MIHVPITAFINGCSCIHIVYFIRVGLSFDLLFDNLIIDFITQVCAQTAFTAWDLRFLSLEVKVSVWSVLAQGLPLFIWFFM